MAAAKLVCEIAELLGMKHQSMNLCGFSEFCGVMGKAVTQTIEQFLNEIRLEGRSSPAGIHWYQFHRFLQSRKTESEDDPPVNLIRARLAITRAT